VTTAVPSLPTIPGNWFGGDPATAVQLSRICNDYAARLVRDHPGRFGLWASLPMLDVDASLAEIGHALDELKADGIGLATAYGDKWPGDPKFKPIFEELNRRKATVFFHPLAPNCCGNLMPRSAEPGA
jgi:6-methylsalicylate decarboxylase